MMIIFIIELEILLAGIEYYYWLLMILIKQIFMRKLLNLMRLYHQFIQCKEFYSKERKKKEREKIEKFSLTRSL